MESNNLVLHIPALSALLVATFWKDAPTTPLLLFVIISYVLSDTLFGKFSSGGKEKNAGSSDAENKADYGIAVVKARPNNGKIEYKLQMHYNGVQWHCWRSYSKFLKFREQFPSSSGSKFPGKSSFYDILSGNESTLEFIEKRRKRLDAVMRESFGEKKDFEAAMLSNQDEKSGRSPAGIFFGAPKSLDLSNANVAPPREYLIEKGVKATREMLVHIKKIQSNPVQEPWKFLSDLKKNDIKCYTFADGDLLHISVSGYTDSNPPDLLEFLIDGDIRGEWDDLHENQTTLDHIYFDQHPEEANLLEDEGFEIVAGAVQHTSIKSPAPMVVAKRDSVTLALISKRKSDGALLLCLTSVEDKRAPPEGANKYIRAKVMCAGSLISPMPNKPGFSMMHTVTLIDPSAYVPHSIIKMIAPTRAAQIADFGELSRKRAATKEPKLGKLIHHKAD